MEYQPISTIAPSYIRELHIHLRAEYPNQTIVFSTTNSIGAGMLRVVKRQHVQYLLM